MKVQILPKASGFNDLHQKNLIKDKFCCRILYLQFQSLLKAQVNSHLSFKTNMDRGSNVDSFYLSEYQVLKQAKNSSKSINMLNILYS
jgi:hypothetical protein